MLLIPSGSSVSAQARLKVHQALDAVRRWYQRELPNSDLQWEPLVVLDGAQTAAHYLSDDNVWSEVPGEIEAALGWNPWTPAKTNRVALILGRDLLGWAGGAGLADGRGMAIVGLERRRMPGSGRASHATRIRTNRLGYASTGWQRILRPSVG